MTCKNIPLRVIVEILLIVVMGYESVAANQANFIGPNTQFFIKEGDITQSHCEAIVNAANPQLEGGGSVCGAIFNAAGWDELQDACDNYSITDGLRCPVGESRITDSFKLKNQGIKYIIHAVGPDCRIIKNIQEQDKLLKNAYTSSLALADKHSIESISFPFISSTIYAFPRERACRIALKAVNEYIKQNNTQIKSIYFMLFSNDDLQLFLKNSRDIL